MNRFDQYSFWWIVFLMFVLGFAVGNLSSCSVGTAQGPYRLTPLPGPYPGVNCVIAERQDGTTIGISCFRE